MTPVTPTDDLVKAALAWYEARDAERENEGERDKILALRQAEAKLVRAISRYRMALFS